jgi:ectoine hydroxylase-related dioxygenase (phytanoyl-CoA dioxygenase family)
MNNTLNCKNLSKSWRDDGFVCVRRAINDYFLKLLKLGVEKALKNPGALSKEYAEKEKGRFFTDHHMRKRIPQFQRFLDESPVAEIAGRIMNTKKLILFDEHLLVKEPRTENPTYWHQDLPYYELTGSQLISLWIPLDPISADSGAVSFIRGSHKWGKIYQPIRIGRGDLVDEADEFDGPAPDIEAEPEKYDIVTFDKMAPGDCLAFNAAVMHYAAPNVTLGTRRRAVSVRFAGDDVTWQPRSYVPNVLDTPNLQPGDPLDSDQYPVVWRA